MAHSEQYTKSIYSILATYITDLFCNKIYLASINKFKSGDATSITESYRKNVLTFIVSFNNIQTIKALIGGVMKYFSETTSFSSLTISEFENRVLVCFVPEEYFTCMRDKEKDRLIEHILTETIKRISVNVLKDYMTNIIDNRKNAATINGTIFNMRAEIVKLLELLRDDLYTKFINKTTNSNNMVSFETAAKMRDALSAEVKKNIEYENKIAAIREMLKQVIKERDEYKLMVSSHRCSVPTYKETRKDVFEDTEKDIFKDTEKDIFKEMSKDVFKETGKDVFKKINKDVFKETGKDVFKETGKDVFKETGKDVFKETGKDVFKKPEEIYRDSDKDSFRDFGRDTFKGSVKNEVYTNPEKTIRSVEVEDNSDNIEYEIFGEDEGDYEDYDDE